MSVIGVLDKAIIVKIKNKSAWYDTRVRLQKLCNNNYSWIIPERTSFCLKFATLFIIFYDLGVSDIQVAHSFKICTNATIRIQLLSCQQVAPSFLAVSHIQSFR